MGRSTLSHSATFHIHAYALTSASGLAGRQIAAWLCKQVAQGAEWLTSAHATSRFVQLYPGVFKALGFCKKVCKAARGLWNHSPWKISSAVSLFSCLLTKKKKNKTAPLPAMYVLNCGRNRLFSSSSCPVNQIDRCWGGSCAFLQVGAGGQREGG